ncbi:uncharacterized protein LOC125745550 isoform X2 [Brienomyrus brachyistius]|uniref:uncharacterized protein LOC125745550 isoform X2 n=1 Tax=Brienomyrus brachyistius TaxID=42636 RepID=UPI0020B1C8EC|nr:uncharacterized protein LOC125745550 isoform X2 [Brienomyrus brachyistius]
MGSCDHHESGPASLSVPATGPHHGFHLCAGPPQCGALWGGMQLVPEAALKMQGGMAACHVGGLCPGVGCQALLPHMCQRSSQSSLHLALALVVQVLLLLHAIPEAHTWLRLASEPCPQTPANVTATGFSEEISLSSWPFGHMQGSWSSQSSSARNTDVEQGPSTPFGSNQSITITIPEEGAVTSI